MATVEESTQKVQRILVSKFNKVILLEDGFAIERGSTRVKIEIKDFGKDSDGNPDSLVHLWAPIGREIPATPSSIGGRRPRRRAIGSARRSCTRTRTRRSAARSSRTRCWPTTSTPGEFDNAIWMVAGTADDLDDKIHDQFGGKRGPTSSRAA